MYDIYIFFLEQDVCEHFWSCDINKLHLQGKKTLEVCSRDSQSEKENTPWGTLAPYPEWGGHWTPHSAHLTLALRTWLLKSWQGSFPKLLMGIRTCDSKICRFWIGLFWAKGNWEATDAEWTLCPPHFCLKGLKFLSVKVFPLSWTRKRKTTHYQRDETGRRLHQQTLLKQPLSSISFPVYLPPYTLPPARSLETPLSFV